jgi:hypothetical protein
MNVRSRLFLTCLLLALASSGFAQARPSPAEQALLQMANQARAQHGAAPLQWDASLARAARAHVVYIVRESGELSHQYPGEPDLVARAANAGAHFGTVSENLARHAQTPAQLHQTWMSTPVHRGNILDPQLNAVGIAVVESQGFLYAVEDFARDVPVPQHGDIERQVAQRLQQHGIAPTASNEDARKTCATPQSTVGTPKLVIQWDGSDPTQLPDVLLQQIATGKFASAAVGACPSQPAGQQFTTYHVAVLLY